MGSLQGAYRKLTALPRVLQIDEIGNVAASFQKSLDNLKSKIITKAVFNKSIKVLLYPYNFLIIDEIEGKLLNCRQL